jgi:hypothetical protein
MPPSPLFREIINPEEKPHKRNAESEAIGIAALGFFRLETIALATSEKMIKIKNEKTTERSIAFGVEILAFLYFFIKKVLRTVY